MVLTTGQKIKNFRKRAKLSQFDLELEIDASPGSLSRMENSNTEPTKETLYKISEVLKLNKFERDYLYGSLAKPASAEEIKLAISSVKKYFESDNTFAYIVDDRRRLIYVSQGFINLMKKNDTDTDKILLKTIPELMLTRKLPIFKFLDNDSYEEMVRFHLIKYYYEASFFFDEDSTNASLEATNNNQLASKIWKKILEDPPKIANSKESRTVTFNFDGNKKRLSYSVEYLTSNQRFLIIEYHL